MPDIRLLQALRAPVASLVDKKYGGNQKYTHGPRMVSENLRVCFSSTWRFRSCGGAALFERP